MAKAISNKNVLDARFEVADFTGKWLASFGRPELRGAWIIYGESGSGKTHFALELLKYLSGFVNKVAYDTLEQGLSKSFQNAWKDAEMQAIGSRVIVLAKEPIKELRERLRKRKSPDVVVIDSITALVGFTRAVFIELINEFPDKLCKYPFQCILEKDNRVFTFVYRLMINNTVGNRLWTLRNTIV